jgi:mRNA interferase HigB
MRSRLVVAALSTLVTLFAKSDVKASYPRASILKASRVVFNIKGNDYRLVAALQYRAGALAIRFFGTHNEYDRIDAETV